MPVRTTRVTRIAALTATLLAATAFVAIPTPLFRAVAEEGQRSQSPEPQAEGSAKDAEHGGHGGMMGGGMQMQGGMHEGGMQGCNMMGGDHAGTKGEGKHGGMQMQGGMHEGGMQGCNMMGGDHAGMMGSDHGGMMGGDHAGMKGKSSGEMHKMMHEMMVKMASHVDERLAAVKSELAITDVQLPRWNTFAEAVRSAARSIEQMHKEMMASEATGSAPTAAASPDPTSGGDKSYPGMEAVKKTAPTVVMAEKRARSLPEKLEALEKRLMQHLDSVKAIETALDPLYASFDDKQKNVADRLMVGPMGLM